MNPVARMKRGFVLLTLMCGLRVCRWATEDPFGGAGAYLNGLETTELVLSTLGCTACIGAVALLLGPARFLRRAGLGRVRLAVVTLGLLALANAPLLALQLADGFGVRIGYFQMPHAAAVSLTLIFEFVDVAVILTAWLGMMQIARKLDLASLKTLARAFVALGLPATFVLATWGQGWWVNAPVPPNAALMKYASKLWNSDLPSWMVHLRAGSHILAGVWLAAAIRHIPRLLELCAVGKCPNCDYDLRGQSLPGCPECGHGRERTITPPGSAK